jgi:integrase
MATVCAVVLPHNKRKDETWNVKIKVTHNRKRAHIDTQHYVTMKQLKKDFSIKDQFILDSLSPQLCEYRKKIGEIGEKLNFHTPQSLCDLLVQGELRAETINFIEFGWSVVDLVKNKKRKGSLGNFKAVMYGLQDFFKSEKVAITEITSKMLKRYEEHLKTPRTMLRPDQFGKIRSIYSKGVTEGGLHNHMRDLRTIFKDAVKFYNNKEKGIEIIKHYPFENYKVVDTPENSKPKLTIDQIKQIRDLKVLKYDQEKEHKKSIRENPEYALKDLIYVLQDSREHQAIELALLSFYMCGMNAVDIYNLPPADEATIYRLNYNRSKTKDRRKDRAFISLHIPDEAIQLYIKYAGKLKLKYADSLSLDHALSFGMRRIGAKLGIKELQFYDFRHAFGDQARNICGFSTEDVGKALNHKDNANKVTDIYIAKNWKLLDKIQRAVISLYTEKTKDVFCSPVMFRYRRTG